MNYSSHMALREKKAQAIKMRKEGATYSHIKTTLNVSKSSLSLWLQDLPLSPARMKEVRDFSPRRIENFRETMRRKRHIRLEYVYRKTATRIGKLSKREVFIAGLFLYWGEGTKTTPTCTSISNTDPSVLCFFIRWLESLGVSKDKLRIKLHLYRDMDAETETKYWSSNLGLLRENFRKPYIKDSKRSGLSYSQKFAHGTCNIMFGNRDITEMILQSLEYIRSEFADTHSV